jgi:hypothetical protein
LATDYEARACIAIWANDTHAAEYFGSRAFQNDGVARNTNMQSVRQSRLIGEARTVGLDFAAVPSLIESSLMGQVTRPARRSALTTVTAALQQCSGPAARVQRALELLGESAGLRAGHIYLCREGALMRVASRDAAADSALDSVVQEQWLQQLQDSATAYLPASDQLSAEPGALAWTSPSRTVYRLLPLKHLAKNAALHVGTVVLVAKDARAMPAAYWETAAAIALRLLEHGDADSVSPE